MSVLLLGLDEVRGPALIRRLIDEGDVVGVVEEDRERGEKWRQQGAHVASGSSSDPDLIERAAQHARSIILFAQDAVAETSVAAVLEAGRLAPETPRIIVFGVPSDPVLEMLRDSAFDYVVLRTGRGGRRLLRKQPLVAPDDLADAVNAADDLGGNPRLDVDLTDPAGWSALGLAPR